MGSGSECLNKLKKLPFPSPFLTVQSKTPKIIYQLQCLQSAASARLILFVCFIPFFENWAYRKSLRCSLQNLHVTSYDICLSLKTFNLFTFRKLSIPESLKAECSFSPGNGLIDPCMIISAFCFVWRLFLNYVYLLKYSKNRQLILINKILHIT